MMERGRRMGWGATALLVTLAIGIGAAGASEKVPRMSIERLKDLMGKPELVILDVRTKSDWDKAQMKIIGAVREDPSKPTKSWAEKYGKDKTLVLYCD